MPKRDGSPTRGELRAQRNPLRLRKEVQAWFESRAAYDTDPEYRARVDARREELKRLEAGHRAGTGRPE